MATITKDILYPGKWKTPKGWVEYSPQRVKHFHDRAKAMLAAAVNIPVCWEHQSDAVPLSADEARAKRAQGTFGHVKDVRLEGEVLVAELEVPDEADAKKLPAVRFVSPEHRHQVTAGNKTWPGDSITHIAVTPRPVQFKQRAFEAVRLSLDAYVQLGAEPPDPGEKPKVKKRKDTDDEEGAPAEGEEGETESERAEGGGDPDLEEGDEEAPSGKSEEDPNDVGRAEQLRTEQIGRITECLAKLGMPLPDGTNNANLLDRLETALRVKDAHENPGAGRGDEQIGETEMNPAPVGLSAAQERRFTRLEKRLLNAERLQLQRRINALRDSGRVTPAIHSKLSQQLTSVQLSLDDNGLAPNRLLDRLEAYEELWPGAADPMGTSRLSGDGTEVELSAEQLGAPQSQAEINAAVDAFQQTAGSKNGQ